MFRENIGLFFHQQCTMTLQQFTMTLKMCQIHFWPEHCHRRCSSTL